MTQEEIAAAVGKDRSSVANHMRLLKLPQEVRAEVAGGRLSMGHARALLAIADEGGQRQVAREVIARNLSVRETEAMVKRMSRDASAAPRARGRITRRPYPGRGREAAHGARHAGSHQPQGKGRPNRDRFRVGRRAPAPVRAPDRRDGAEIAAFRGINGCFALVKFGARIPGLTATTLRRRVFVFLKEAQRPSASAVGHRK